MKKIFLFLAFTSLAITSCNKDDDTTSTDEVSIETQNTYDDQAIQKFLNDNYVDDRGNIVAFSDTDASYDNKPKLSSMNPVTLASGVVYIKFDGAQPTSGKVIEEKDKLRLMHNTVTYVATKGTDGVVKFNSQYPFKNTISGGYIDFQTTNNGLGPYYYYVPKVNGLDKYNTDYSTTYTRSFFEIEGLREALQHFESFEISDSENYRLQGIIIIPSRAAFARDDHYPYANYSFRNRSFVFNFQVYKATTRPANED